MSKEVFRLGELFCGPGGIACGAHRAVSDDGEKSIVHAWANDFDPDTCETYVKNICRGDGSSVYCQDKSDFGLLYGMRESDIGRIIRQFPENQI